MKRILSIIFCLFIFISFGQQGWAATGAPDVNADSYLLVDFHSGVQLAEKNPDKRIEPASITKLMTAYVIYKELDKKHFTSETWNCENCQARMTQRYAYHHEYLSQGPS